MAKLFDPHKYGFSPCSAARSEWRDMNETGQVHGLPSSHGHAIATNGILVVIERGQDFIVGHLAHWVEDKQPKEQRSNRKPRKVVEEIIFIP
jgi:hypothetical protein